MLKLDAGFLVSPTGKFVPLPCNTTFAELCLLQAQDDVCPKARREAVYMGVRTTSNLCTSSRFTSAWLENILIYPLALRRRLHSNEGRVGTYNNQCTICHTQHHIRRDTSRPTWISHCCHCNPSVGTALRLSTLYHTNIFYLACLIALFIPYLFHSHSKPVYLLLAYSIVYLVVINLLDLLNSASYLLCIFIIYLYSCIYTVHSCSVTPIMDYFIMWHLNLLHWRWKMFNECIFM